MLFRGKYGWLSNFSKFPYPVMIDGREWLYAECYYLSCMTDDKELIDWASNNTPVEVKRASRLWKLKDGYGDAYRIRSMEKTIDVKFDIPLFRNKLLALEEHIVEDNYHRDTFFGRCMVQLIGENHLGKIITKKRKQLLKIYGTNKVKYTTGNIVDITGYDYTCFTANSVVKRNGALVMGAGSAKAIRDKYKDIDLYFGERIINHSKFGMCVNEDKHIIAFQTKTRYVDKSNISTLVNSIDKLIVFANDNKEKSILLPFPCINHGGLSIVEVEPYLRRLPSNVTVITHPSHTYTGVGARDTPTDIKNLMTDIAIYLMEKGYLLRSGGAPGSDVAFEKGVTDERQKRIHLPWPKFNGSTSTLVCDNKQAEILASCFHDAYPYLTRPVKKLMDRNGYQVLGEELNLMSDFLICYTKDGKRTRTNESGGTGQAIDIANNFNIKVYNLGNVDDLKYWKEKIDS